MVATFYVLVAAVVCSGQATVGVVVSHQSDPSIAEKITEAIEQTLVRIENPIFSAVPSIGPNLECDPLDSIECARSFTFGEEPTHIVAYSVREEQQIIHIEAALHSLVPSERTETVRFSVGSVAEACRRAELLIYRYVLWRDRSGIEEMPTDAPVQTGTVVHVLPEGAVATVENLPEQPMVWGNGSMEHVPAGSYRITVTGDTFEPYSETVDVAADKITVFAPRLTHPRESDTHGRETATAEDTSISSQLGAAPSETTPAQTLEIESDASRVELAKPRSELLTEYEEATTSSRQLRNLKYSAFSTAVLGVGLSAISVRRANTLYNRYLNATVTQEAISHRKSFERWDITSYVSSAIGIVAVGLSFWLSTREDPEPAARARLEMLKDATGTEIGTSP